MKCIRCGRELKDPESIKRQAGTTCAEILGIDAPKKIRCKKVKSTYKRYRQKELFGGGLFGIERVPTVGTANGDNGSTI